MAGPDKDFPTEEEEKENQEKDISKVKDFLNNFFWFMMGSLAMLVVLYTIGTYINDQ